MMMMVVVVAAAMEEQEEQEEQEEGAIAAITTPTPRILVTGVIPLILEEIGPRAAIRTVVLPAGIALILIPMPTPATMRHQRDRPISTEVEGNYSFQVLMSSFRGHGICSRLGWHSARKTPIQGFSRVTRCLCVTVDILQSGNQGPIDPLLTSLPSAPSEMKPLGKSAWPVATGSMAALDAICRRNSLRSVTSARTGASPC